MTHPKQWAIPEKKIDETTNGCNMMGFYSKFNLFKIKNIAGLI